MPNPNYILAAILVVAAIFFLRRAYLRSLARERAWFAGKKIVEGRLTRCDLVTRSDEEDYWCAIEYRVKGIAYQLTGSFHYKPADIGKKIRIAYDPKLPSEARLVPEE